MCSYDVPGSLIWVSWATEELVFHFEKNWSDVSCFIGYFFGKCDDKADMFVLICTKELHKGFVNLNLRVFLRFVSSILVDLSEFLSS